MVAQRNAADKRAKRITAVVLKAPERDIGVPTAPRRAIMAVCGTFALLAVALALLARAGVVSTNVAPATVALCLAASLAAAVFSHGRRPVDFYVGGRAVSGLAGGAALAAALAGLASLFADEAAVRLIVGLALGTAAAAALAPRLRRYGGYTAADFLAARFGPAARLSAAALGFAGSGLLLLAAAAAAGALLGAIFGIPAAAARQAALGVAAAIAFAGGMRSLTWAGVLLFIIAALAAGSPLFLATFGFAGPSEIAAPAGEPAAAVGGRHGLAVLAGLATIACGAAALGMTSARALAAPSGRRAAGATLKAGVLFLALAAATGVSLLLLKQAGVRLAGLTAGDPASHARLAAALPSLGAGFVEAGLAAALVALAAHSLFAASAALSHDIYDESLDRRGGSGRRIVAARLLIVGTAIAAASAAARFDASPALLAACGLALVAAGLAPVLALALCWWRCTLAGALCGMAAGAAAPLLLGLANAAWSGPAADGLSLEDVLTLGFFGALINLAATVLVSLATRAPTGSQDLLAAIRREGTIMRERPA
jgi:Na+(H+)/acetate symporter ActP